MLKVYTAGESHGKGILTLIQGLPAGIEIQIESIEKELLLRREGFGRGQRMVIEKDEVEILAGVFKGKTTGSPLAILIKNTEYEKWKGYFEGKEDVPDLDRFTCRPGHADYAGAVKYGFESIRPVLERASARHTAAYVAAGAVFKKVLELFKVHIGSFLVSAGDYSLNLPKEISLEDLNEAKKNSLLLLNKEEEAPLKQLIKDAGNKGTTLGGCIAFCAFGVIPGIGSYAEYFERLDFQLGGLLMAIPSVKAVEIGNGIAASKTTGDKANDEFFIDKEGYVKRKTNIAGGIEGGVSNGEPVYGRLYFKPIPTQRKPLKGFDLKECEEKEAFYERSDVFVGKAIGIIAESMVAYALLKGYLLKFGGDSIKETLEAFKNYRQRLRWSPDYELHL